MGEYHTVVYAGSEKKGAKQTTRSEILHASVRENAYDDSMEQPQKSFELSAEKKALTVAEKVPSQPII